MKKIPIRSSITHFLILLILLGWLLLVAPPAQAISLTVSPVRVEYQVPAGGSLTDAISVLNDDTAPAHIRVRIEDWSLTPEGTVIFTKAGSLPYSASPWLRVSPQQFTLAPGQAQEVRYSLTVPKEAAPGGYRAAIIFSTVVPPKPGERERRVALEGRIVTILYQTVGRPVPSGEITDLSFRLGPEGRPEFTISFRNTGPIHIRTRGEIVIRAKGGQGIARLPLPDLPILPQSRRDFQVKVEEKLPPGEYTAELTMDIGRKELLAGERKFSIPE